jgi:NADH dehydrogenase (ubiquinone) 1 alpha subcomplex subunit 6
MCRDAPAVIKMYNLEQTTAEVRHMVLLQFRKNSTATDPRVVDMLIARGEMELEETRNQWKQKGHLANLMTPELIAADPLLDVEEFFRRFIDGTLEDRHIWKDHNVSEQRRILQQVAALENTSQQPMQ